ncbi:hypothetical protein [Nostoc sp.]|uniref:hypothetical protein n=1 Tax=Nostoc sp. TaxID=1180 RepID=UPI002FF4D140
MGRIRQFICIILFSSDRYLLPLVFSLETFSKIMANWSDSYLGKLRQVVGERLLLLFGARVIIEAANF